MSGDRSQFRSRVHARSGPWFAQNFSEGYLREPALAGVVALPAGEVREPIVDADDIADVAVAALTKEGHNRKLYEVTGPRLMTFDEIARALSVAMGSKVRYQPITLEAFHAEMKVIDGELVADVISGICRETLDGPEYVVGRRRPAGLGPAAARFPGLLSCGRGIRGLGKSGQRA